MSRAFRTITFRSSRPNATLGLHATPPPQTPYEVFDETSKARHRDRAILRLEKQSADVKVVDYVREELAERLAERVEVCKIAFSPPLAPLFLPSSTTSVLQLPLHPTSPSTSFSIRSSGFPFSYIVSSAGSLIRSGYLITVNRTSKSRHHASSTYPHMPDSSRACSKMSYPKRRGNGGWSSQVVSTLSQPAPCTDLTQEVHYIGIPIQPFLVSTHRPCYIANGIAVPPMRIEASPSQLLAHPDVNELRETMDAVVSASGLHWVGDIVGQS